MPSKHSLGVIHGRFQVLHNDHMRYLLAGKERCEHLVVGVTNPDPCLTQSETADAKRDAAVNNPLTYWERQCMLRAALREAGLAWESFSIVPLPVNMPELYCHYVPMEAVFYLTIYDDWGRAKLRRFKELGLNVEVMWERSPAEKGISAADVRRAMIDGEHWRNMVPASAARLLLAWKIADRLRKMTGNMVKT